MILHMKASQESVADYLARDARPVHEWAQRMGRLQVLLYERDAELSRWLELFVRSIESFAANLDCVGTDDPAAPAVGASTQAVLGYLFGRWPERGAEFRKLISHADQLLGRHTLVHSIE